MKILVCVDGSECANRAVKYAAQFAKNYKADLTVIYVIESERSKKKLASDDYGDEQHKAKKIMKDAEGIISQVAPDIIVDRRVAVGPISAEIVRIAEDGKFDSIVVGTKGRRGLTRMLMGSVADDVVHYSHCPVVVVR